MRIRAYSVDVWGTGCLRWDDDGALVGHDEPEPGARVIDRGASPADADGLVSRLVAVLGGSVDDFLDIDCGAAADAAGLTPFEVEVIAHVRRIPRGESASYAEIAELAGRPRAWRAVGTACGRGVLSIIVPYHRVIRSNGDIGDYGPLGTPRKRRLLELEGFRAL